MLDWLVLKYELRKFYAIIRYEFLCSIMKCVCFKNSQMIIKAHETVKKELEIYALRCDILKLLTKESHLNNLEIAEKLGLSSFEVFVHLRVMGLEGIINESN